KTSQAIPVRRKIHHRSAASATSSRSPIIIMRADSTASGRFLPCTTPSASGPGRLHGAAVHPLWTMSLHDRRSTIAGQSGAARRLTGGVTVRELPDEILAAVGRALRPTDFVLAPLPNQLFTRDTSAWVYGGVVLTTMFWPARQKESLNVEAIYRFHPRFRNVGFPIWFGGVDHNWGSATIEGGDIMPIGDGVVLVGQGERSTGRATSILAKNLFDAGAARLVIGAQMPR